METTLHSALSQLVGRIAGPAVSTQSFQRKAMDFVTEQVIFGGTWIAVTLLSMCSIRIAMTMWTWPIRLQIAVYATMLRLLYLGLTLHVWKRRSDNVVFDPTSLAVPIYQTIFLFYPLFEVTVMKGLDNCFKEYLSCEEGHMAITHALASIGLFVISWICIRWMRRLSRQFQWTELYAAFVMARVIPKRVKCLLSEPEKVTKDQTKTKALELDEEKKLILDDQWKIMDPKRRRLRKIQEKRLKVAAAKAVVKWNTVEAFWGYIELKPYLERKLSKVKPVVGIEDEYDLIAEIVIEETLAEVNSWHNSAICCYAATFFAILTKGFSWRRRNTATCPIPTVGIEDKTTDTSGRSNRPDVCPKQEFQQLFRRQTDALTERQQQIQRLEVSSHALVLH